MGSDNAVLDQGIRVLSFLKENTDVPIYFQKKLSPRASYLQLDRAGWPAHFILPFPFEPIRQLVDLHEYGHYLDDRMRHDPLLYDQLKKKKAAKKNRIILNKLTGSELIAWSNALEIIRNEDFVFSPDAFAEPLLRWGLRSFIDMYNGDLPEIMKSDIHKLFIEVECVSLGFLQLPEINDILNL